MKILYKKGIFLILISLCFFEIPSNPASSTEEIELKTYFQKRLNTKIKLAGAIDRTLRHMLNPNNKKISDNFIIGCSEIISQSTMEIKEKYPIISLAMRVFMEISATFGYGGNHISTLSGLQNGLKTGHISKNMEKKLNDIYTKPENKKAIQDFLNYIPK